jgi:ArsR family transcriptional regulator
MWICAYTVIGQGIAMQELIKATKALSDETRLRILNLLLERACCVCEVMQALDISQSRASRNLGILQDAGFLTAKRDGLWIVYSIDWQTTNSHAASLAKLLKDSPIADELTALDKVRLKQAVRK